ncbi:MAG: SAM-dependent methyltransferase [Betaproteobacteria bacterium]|nr:SAM-dependent methyltransferase [Betaproteobacteria bacterium]
MGAGPGAADLLTVRVVRVLARAGIVVRDAPVDPAALALALAAVEVAVGKRCGAHRTHRRFVDRRRVDAAVRHAVVVRLEGGRHAVRLRATGDRRARRRPFAHGVPRDRPVALVGNASLSGRARAAGTLGGLPALAATRCRGLALIVPGEVRRRAATGSRQQAVPRAAPARPPRSGALALRSAML